MKALQTFVTGGIESIFGSPEINDIFQVYSIKENHFYHCTPTDEALESINSGNLRLTRADSFEDETELLYGLTIFKEVLYEEFLNDARIVDLINEAQQRLLESTFILSGSRKRPNAQHIKKYGKHVISFNVKSMLKLLHGSFREVDHSGNYSPFLSSLNNRYVGFEGKVIYDSYKQKEIVRKTLKLLLSNFSEDMFEKGYRDYKLTTLLINSVCLFKREEYEPENEYRFILISRYGEYQLHNKNNKYFIEIRSPKPKDNYLA